MAEMTQVLQEYRNMGMASTDCRTLCTEPTVEGTIEVKHQHHLKTQGDQKLSEETFGKRMHAEASRSSQSNL